MRPVVGMAATSDGKGYWLVASDGGIFAFGDATFHGSMGGNHLNARSSAWPPRRTAADTGWSPQTAGSSPSVTRKFHGSMGGRPSNEPVVGMAATSDGNGYWLVASDGGIFAFGDAKFHGSMGGRPLNEPVVGMAADVGRKTVTGWSLQTAGSSHSATRSSTDRWAANL